MGDSKVKAVSLFSGIGGLDIGLEKAGAEISLQVDNDPRCWETLVLNWQKDRVAQMDLSNADVLRLVDEKELRGDIDIVVGGPPCQPFSKSVHWSNPDGSKRSPLEKFPLALVKIASKIGAKAFIIENVPGLCSKRHEATFLHLLQKANEIGFKLVAHQILDASNFNVPQRRKRLFIVGFREKNDFSFDNLNTSNEFISCGEAFNGLISPSLLKGLEVNGRWGKYLPEIPPGYNYQWLTEKGGSNKKVFKYRSKYWNFLLKLHPDMPSWTIQSSPGPYTGPFHWENRRLTISELKRLQGLPDDYIISGDIREQIRQIGNCVPPPMAQAVGEAVASYL